MSKIGLIQSRGLGDICLALPIAHYLHQVQGHDIIWPICEEFLPSVQTWVPWVQWRPMKTDPQGRFFLEEPQRILSVESVDDQLCLYQSLSTNPEFSQVPWFQIQKFDEYKYTRAGVPFHRKWQLRDCIVDQPQERQQLLAELNLALDQPYYVTHTTGSDYACEPNLADIPPEWRRIRVEDHGNHSIFAWQTVLEGARAVIAIDSVMANMIDQLLIPGDLYWIPRSHIHLTPVLGNTWTILDAPRDSRAATRIFASG